MVRRRTFSTSTGPISILTFLVVGALALPASGYPGASPFVPEKAYAENFPDPHVVFDRATKSTYAYGTNTGGETLPTMASKDQRTWIAESTDFTPPSWAAPVDAGVEVWAPSVQEMPDGEWLAYFSIRESTATPQNRYCISVASGPGPLGPFVDDSEAPLTCGYGAAGTIDPWVYLDPENQAWLIWKTEDHRRVLIADDDVHFPLTDDVIAERQRSAERGEPAALRALASAPDAIWSQRLDPSGLAFFQPDDDTEPRSWAAVLLTASADNWEGKLIESPALFDVDGQIHLLYSGNRWQSHEYATGWARCDSPAGPCQRTGATPLFGSNGEVNGPGGASVFVDGAGDHRIAYHAWNAPYVDYPSFPACDIDFDGVCADEGQRFLHIDLLCSLPSGALHVDVPAGWRFCDVEPSTWFGPGVAWMAKEGITTGISEGRFAPAGELTRADAVTFLWRWAGAPQAEGPSPFSDVEPGRYYSDAVVWAAAVGVIKGTTPTTFSPDYTVDRGQIVTMLHRIAGTPAPSVAAPFVDVPAGRYYSDATAWAAEFGVTTGVTATEFEPARQSSRSQVATMLCRFSRVPPTAGAITGAAEVCPGLP